MEYILIVVIVPLASFFIGILGSNMGWPTPLTAMMGGLVCGLMVYLVLSQAHAVPVDVEAFKQPVTYRECRPLTVDDVNSGKDSLPLPPECAPDKRQPKQ